MNSSTNVDTNIRNYTISELIAILGLDDIDPTSEEISEKTDEYISRFTNENNLQMKNFFSEMQSILLNYVDELKNTTEDAGMPQKKKQTNDWYENEYIKQSDPVQTDKITDRKQKIDIYDDEHVPMNRKQLGIANNFNVSVAQDTLNPNLKNSTERFINLDSQFRQSSGAEESSTNYTLDLSDPLTNVLSLRLYSFQIPYTWYTIDSAYGNNILWITDISYSLSIPVCIEPGNYNPADFIIILAQAFTDAGFSPISSSITDPNASIYYNQNNAKIKLNLSGVHYDVSGNPSFTISTDTIITFFDYSGELKTKTLNSQSDAPNISKCSIAGCSNSLYINQTLGWIMGFRLPYINVDASGNQAPAVLDLNGPRYLILSIDDYNQNHINNGLVTITELSRTLKMPTYYSPDLPYTKYIPKSNLQDNINSINQNANVLDSGDLLMDKLTTSFKCIPQVLPSAPRTLTQSQIYTINEIIKNNDRNTNYRATAPTTTDVFALIPVKSGMITGKTYVELSGSLQDNKRTYFGPVNIDRMRVRLLDDKGNILNLNGAEWSISIISENLYQY